MSTGTCHNCGTKIVDHAKFCPNCGIPFQIEQHNESIICSKCGTKTESQYHYCPICGNPLTSKSQFSVYENKDTGLHQYNTDISQSQNNSNSYQNDSSKNKQKSDKKKGCLSLLIFGIALFLLIDVIGGNSDDSGKTPTTKNQSAVEKSLITLGFTQQEIANMVPVFEECGVTDISNCKYIDLEGQIDGLSVYVDRSNGNTFMFSVSDGQIFNMGWNTVLMYGYDIGIQKTLSEAKAQYKKEQELKEVSSDAEMTLMYIAEDTAKQIVNYPSTVDFHTFDWKFTRDEFEYAVQGSFDCSNAFGVKETHLLTIYCRANENYTKMNPYKIVLDGVTIKDQDLNSEATTIPSSETKGTKESPYLLSAQELYNLSTKDNFSNDYLSKWIQVTGKVERISNYPSLTGYYILGETNDCIICWVDSNDLVAQKGQTVTFLGQITISDYHHVEIAYCTIVTTNPTSKPTTTPSSETKGSKESPYLLSAQELYNLSTKDNFSNDYLSKWIQVTGKVERISNYPSLTGYYILGETNDCIICWVDSNDLVAQKGQTVTFLGQITISDYHHVEIAYCTIVTT